MKVHMISTSLRPESRSRQLLACVGEELAAQGCDVACTDLLSLPPCFCDGRPLVYYPPAYQILVRELRASQAVVLGLPIHQWAASGAFKNLIEIVAPGLTEKVVGVVSASGSPRSYLATTGVMASLTFDLQCIVLPETLQASADEDFDGERIAQFGRKLLHLAAALTPRRTQSGYPVDFAAVV